MSYLISVEQALKVSSQEPIEHGCERGLGWSCSDCFWLEELDWLGQTVEKLVLYVGLLPVYATNDLRVDVCNVIVRCQVMPWVMFMYVGRTEGCASRTMKGGSNQCVSFICNVALLFITVCKSG